MKSAEIPGNHSGFADESYDPKIVLISWILHQSMHNSLTRFVCKISKLLEKYYFTGQVLGAFSPQLGHTFKTSTLFLV